ncbi:hypothetical protein [Undibacterium curvum]|uniref:hypothetical protein n=1 Tax=Undibacterium curvum TaxID=2762294 RepID=UPI003D12F40E
MVDITNYADFESALDEAFPLDPKPSFDWSDGRVAEEARVFFSKKNWRECVGFKVQLFDCFFSRNLELFPIEVSEYYLPAFLLSASLDLYGAKEKHSFPSDIADGLLLAIPNTEEMREKTDHALCPFGLVTSCPNGRVQLYRALTPSQRKCVASFLRLFWSDYWVASGAVNEDRQLLFDKIVDCWDQSTFDMGNSQSNFY